MIQRTVLSLSLLLCLLGRVVADDWPQYRGPERNDISKETGLLPVWPAGGPKRLWTFRDAGAGYSGMSIAGDRLYSMGADATKDCVYALDLNTRKKLWSVEIGPRHNGDIWGAGPHSTPTVDGNFLYALDMCGNLVCVDTIAGKKVWSQKLKTCNESPLVDRDQLVVTSDGKKGGMTAFDKKTGTLKWCSTDLGGSSASMIAIESGGVRQYIQSTGSAVFGVRASDGKLLWQLAKNNNADVAQPIYQDNCVYVSSSNGGSLLLELLSEGGRFKPKVIYANNRMRNDYFGVVLVGGYLYGCFEKFGWVCQDFKTGKILWGKKTGGLGMGLVTYADGHLYCYHENRGDVLLLKATPAGYQEQGRFRIPEETKLPRQSGKIWTRPVVANGKLYLRDQDLIFCYDIHKPR